MKIFVLGLCLMAARAAMQPSAEDLSFDAAASQSFIELQALSHCFVNETCLNGGECILGSCDCAWEYFGETCECYIPSLNLESDHPAVLDLDHTGFFNFDELTISVNISVKYYDVDLGFVDRDTGTEVCDFSPHDVTNGLNCEADMYTTDQAWDHLRDNCGFHAITSTDEAFQIYEGVVRAIVFEDLESIRGTDYFRKITYDMPVQIWLPTEVTVETQILVFAPINVEARLVQQYTADETKSGSFIFSTNVQHPYKLVDPTVDPSAVSDVGIDSTVDGAPLPGCEDDGEPCLQNWEVELTLHDGVCYLNDNYLTHFGVVCHPNFNGDCPTDVDEAHIELVLESNNVCSQIVAVASVHGSMEAFEDATLTTTTTEIVSGDHVYLEITTWSDELTVAHTTITDITVTDVTNGPVYSMYSSGAVTQDGTGAALAVRDSDELATDDNAEFNFIPSDLISLGLDETAWIEIIVDLYVELGENAKAVHHRGKFLLQANEDASVITELSIEIIGGAEAPLYECIMASCPTIMASCLMNEGCQTALAMVEGESDCDSEVLDQGGDVEDLLTSCFVAAGGDVAPDKGLIEFQDIGECIICCENGQCPKNPGEFVATSASSAKSVVVAVAALLVGLLF